MVLQKTKHKIEFKENVNKEKADDSREWTCHYLKLQETGFVKNKEHQIPKPKTQHQCFLKTSSGKGAGTNLNIQLFNCGMIKIFKHI